MVGAVGTLLGSHDINISRMQLALRPDRGEAAMLVNVDPAPGPEVLAQLRGLPHMISAELVDLGR